MFLNLPSDRRGSAGPEAVDLAALAGLFLDDWQEWVLFEALSEAVGGQWSAFEVAVLVSRQNGKGSILEARQLAGLFLLHERLQVHTAHEFKTCFEHFLRVVQLIEGCPDLDRRVARIRRGAGEQAIELKTGERLRFLARSSGSGRGMSGDVVYLDEAFALTSQMMGALLPTLSARPNPQIWYTTSAPKSTSEVLLNLRDRGHRGGSPRLFMAEWGHGRGIDITDRAKWYDANPALGIRITEEFIEAELDALQTMPDEFARERLGVPDNPPNVHDTIVSPEVWANTLDVTIPPRLAEAQRVVSWDVSPDRSQASVAWVALRADGCWHQEVVESRPGTDWVAARVASYVAGAGSVVRAVAVVKGSPAYALAGDVAGLGVVVTELPSSEFAAGCGSWFDKVSDGSLRRCASGWLDSAVSGAVWADHGQTRVFDRRRASTDITALCAVVSALRAFELLPFVVKDLRIW